MPSVAVTVAEPLTEPDLAGTVTSALVSNVTCTVLPLEIVVVETCVKAGTVISEALEF